MLCSDTKICLSEEDGLHTECLMHHASLFIATRYRGVFALEGLVAALVLVTPAHRHHRPSHNLLFVADRPDQKWLAHDLSVRDLLGQNCCEMRSAP